MAKGPELLTISRRAYLNSAGRGGGAAFNGVTLEIVQVMLLTQHSQPGSGNDSPARRCCLLH